MNQYGPMQSDFWGPRSPPPPPGPQIAKNVNVFILWQIWTTCYSLFSLFYVCVQCDEVFITLWYPWIQHTVSHALDFNSKVLIRLLTYFTCCWDYGFGVKSILNYSCLEPYLWVLLTRVYTDLGRPGGTFAVAGDRAI